MKNILIGFIPIICLVFIIAILIAISIHVIDFERSYIDSYITTSEEQAIEFTEIIQQNDIGKYSVKQKIKEKDNIIIQYEVKQDNKSLTEHGVFKTKDEKIYQRFLNLLNKNELYILKESK